MTVFKRSEMGFLRLTKVELVQKEKRAFII